MANYFEISSCSPSVMEEFKTSEAVTTEKLLECLNSVEKKMDDLHAALGESSSGPPVLPPVLLVTKLSPEAKIPTRGTAGSAGCDLYAAKKVIVPAGRCRNVPTGVSLRMPKGTFGQIAGRSGHSLYHMLQVGPGVVDKDYTGEIFITLFNHGYKDYPVQAGERCAQLVLAHYTAPKVFVFDSQEPPPPLRGEQGFGSTGA